MPGKSWVIAETIKQNALNKNVLVIQPTVELKEQNKEKFLLATKDLNVDISKVKFETLSKVYLDIKNDLITPNSFSLVIYDECQHFEIKNKTYMATFECFKNIPKIGFTGSPYRYINKSVYNFRNKSIIIQNKLVMLAKEYSKYITEPIFNVNHQYLVNQGYLVNPTYIHYYNPVLLEEIQDYIGNDCPVDENDDNQNGIDFSILKEHGRSYSKGCMISLMNALYKCSLTKNKIIIYCNTSYQIKLFEKLFPQFIINQLTDKTTKKQRNEIIKNFKESKKAILFNVKILKEGFDCGDLDCLIMATPLSSIMLYVQIVGRLIRCNNGNENKKPYFVDLFGSFKKFGKLENIKMKPDGYLYIADQRADCILNNDKGYELKLRNSKLSNNANFK